MPLPKTLFVDRDGVLNRKMPEGAYVERWSQFEFLPGAVEALRKLRAAGVKVVVVTNQRGVALGRMTLADVDAIHAAMQASLARKSAEVDAIYVCPHETDTCDCRKPALGLFERAMADDPAIDLHEAAVVGDSASDIVAANRLGCPAHLIATAERAADQLAAHPELRVDSVAPSLLAWVSDYLGL